MEPMDLSMEVAPVADWPAERLTTAYSFLARRLARLLGADDEASRAEVAALRPHCEELGMELVARGLI